MKYFYNIFLLIIIAFVSSCHKNSGIKNVQPEYLIDIDIALSDEPYYLSTIFSSYKIIELEAKEECIVNRINNLFILNDTIYIFDRQLRSVYLFDIEGHYISKINQIGRGPGEYNHPVDLDIDTFSNELLIFDWTTRKMNYYKTDGQFLRSKQFPFRFLSYKTTYKRIYTYIPYPENINDKHSFLIKSISKDVKTISNHLKYNDDSHLPRMIEFLTGGNFFLTDYDLKFYRNYDNTIYSIMENEIRPYISLLTEKYKITNSDIEEVKLKKLPIILLGKQKLSRINEYSENSGYCIFKFNIGFKNYYVIIDKRFNKIVCTSRIIDDLSYQHPNFFRFLGNKYVGIVESVNYLKPNFSDSTSLNLLNIRSFINPTIIIYDIK